MESLNAFELMRKGRSPFLLERSVDYGLTFLLLWLAPSRAVAQIPVLRCYKWGEINFLRDYQGQLYFSSFFGRFPLQRVPAISDNFMSLLDSLVVSLKPRTQCSAIIQDHSLYELFLKEGNVHILLVPSHPGTYIITIKLQSIRPNWHTSFWQSIILIILTEMKRSGTNLKPSAVTSLFKFQKVQKLTHLIHEAAEHTQGKDVGDRVLDVLKTHIRANYGNLYNNYSDNKKKILKQIQAVETNIAGENAMNSKFDDLLKDKSKYDKMHAEVANKQRALKKLQEINKQLAAEQSTSRVSIGVQNTTQEAALAAAREEYDHFLILGEMLASRKSVELSQHQRILRLKQQLSGKEEKMSRLARENQKKQETLRKLTAELQKENQIEIPLRLAEELSLKIQMYENKYSYHNIIQHEAILNQQRLATLKETLKIQKQKKKVQRMQRQQQQKAQIQQLRNLVLIKNYQQQKIKKYCRVQSISEAFKLDKLFKAASMEELCSEIESSISALEQENKRLCMLREQQMGVQAENQPRGNSYHYQSLLAAAEKQKSHLKQQASKWESKANQWLTTLALLQIQPTHQGFASFIASKILSDAKPRLEESRTNTENGTCSKSDLR